MTKRKQLEEHYKLLAKIRTQKELLSNAEQSLKLLYESEYYCEQAEEIFGNELEDAKQKVRELEAQRDSAEPLISSIISEAKDVRIRLILQLRFIRGLTWKEVGSICGQSCETVKAAGYRYLASIKEP